MSTDRKPNIVYIHSHDTGRYVEPYGYNVQTPNLQHFAEQSVLFRNAFTINPTCSPSRAALLTSSFPHQNGMLGLAHRGFRLHDYKQHIIHTLHEAGYTSALAGVQHIASDENAATDIIGYQEKLSDNSGGLNVANAAVRYIQRDHDKPFFLSAGFMETHRMGPYFQHPKDPADDERYLRPPAILPDTPSNRLDFAEYRSQVRTLDMAMGRIVQAIDESGLGDNTIIIITTDHGIAFPHMKCNLTNHGTGVMLMMRTPKAMGFTGGQVVEAMVTQMDIVPTVCELAGVNTPGHAMGQSLVPLVVGESETLHDDVFTTVNVHAAVEPMRSVRTPQFNYIRRFTDREKLVATNVDNGYSKTTWAEAGWLDRPLAKEELYDLTFDPMERNNVAEEVRYAAVLADMRQRLDGWMRRTDDPLCDGGELPLPKGAILNDPDEYDPGTKKRIIVE